MAAPSLAVDFSAYQRDMLKDALDRLPFQFIKSCVLREFIAVFIRQVQELYDTAIQSEQRRSLAEADGVRLDGLGRIVGEDRAPYQYTEAQWFHSDTPDQSTDLTQVWCINGLLSEYIPAEDPDYRTLITTRIVKNHTLTASVPEMSQLAYLISGQYISYEKVGPYQVNLIVPSVLTRTMYNILTQAVDTQQADHSYRVPYPATLNISGVFIYVPWRYMLADTGGDRTPDVAGCAVMVTNYTGE